MTAGARVLLRIVVLVGLTGAVGSLEAASAQSPGELGAAEAALEYVPDAVQRAPDAGTPSRSTSHAFGTAPGEATVALIGKSRGVALAASSRVRHDRLIVVCLSPSAPNTGSLICSHDRPLWRTPGLLRVGGASVDEPDSTIA